jgi:hypothetical protein
MLTEQRIVRPVHHLRQTIVGVIAITATAPIRQLPLNRPSAGIEAVSDTLAVGRNDRRQPTAQITANNPPINRTSLSTRFYSPVSDFALPV